MASFLDTLKGIENVKQTCSGQYFSPGDYVLEIAEIRAFESQKAAGQWYFCVEATVLSTTSPDWKPGQMGSWLVNMNHQIAQQNIAGFMSGLDPESDGTTAESVDLLTHTDQPARGARVKATFFLIKTNAGNDFTKAKWFPYVEA